MSNLKEEVPKVPNFSDEETQQFINAGGKIAGKPVLSALICVIEEGPAKGLSSDESKRICERLRKLIPFDFCMPAQIEFRETPYKLNITLSLVARTYRASVDVPSDAYAQDLYKQYDFLKAVAIAYWRQFVEENETLFKRICSYRTDIDFTHLIVDAENPTTLYFDPACAKRIGIFNYWLSPNGQPLYKK